jgi:hypothetical protein
MTTPEKVTLNLSSNLLEPFQYDDDSKHTAASRWAEWTGEFDLYCAASNVANDDQVKKFLLLTAGREVRRIYQSLTPDKDKEKELKYVQVVGLLNGHFKPQECTRFS